MSKSVKKSSHGGLAFSLLRILIGGFGGLLFFLFCPAIAFPWSGTIIDKGTKRPVEGTVIIRSWDRYYLTVEGTHHQLLSFKETASDGRGRFSLFPKTLHVGIPGIYGIEENRPIVYKPGYRFLILEDKRSKIKLEKVPTFLDNRKKERENAEHSDLDYYVTELFRDIIEREDDFLTRRKVTPTVYKEVSGPFDFSYDIRAWSEKVGIGTGKPILTPPPLPSGKIDRGGPLRKLQGSESIDQLVMLLGDKDWRVRVPAEEELVAKGSIAVDPLIGVLRDENSAVRSGAARILGKIKDPRAVKPLLLALTDSQRMVRVFAAEALGEIQDTAALDPLIKTLEDEDWQVRGNAAEALGKLKSARATQVLVTALDDKTAYVRQKAAWALGEIGDPVSIQALIKTVGDEDSYVSNISVRALIQIGTLSVEPLVASLKDDHCRVRRGAAQALGRIKDRRAVVPLIKALKDEDPEVRKNAAKALGEIKDPAAVEPLIAALDDNAARGLAAEALLQIKDPSAIDLFSKLLSSDNEFFRKIGVNALGGIKDPRAAEKLIPFLKESPGSAIRSMAQESLLAIGAPAVEPLIMALQDMSLEIREGAAWPLGIIKDSRAVEPLISSLRDTNSEVKKSAALALGRIKDPRAIKPLITLWADRDYEVRLRAAEVLAGMDPMALDLLTQTLGHRNSYFRWRSASVLGTIKNPRATDHLAVLLKDKVSEVKWTAAEALGEIKERKAIRALVDALQDEDPGIRAIIAESLFKITGEDFGTDYKTWMKLGQN